MEAFVFFYPDGFLGLMSLPFACLELSFSLTVTHLWHAGWGWCKHTCEDPDAHMKSPSSQTKSWWMWNPCRKIVWPVAENNLQHPALPQTAAEKQMPLFVQGPSMCGCVCLQLLRNAADASVWYVLEMCPWPPISATLFAHCNAAPISIKPIPAMNHYEPPPHLYSATYSIKTQGHRC